MKHIGTFPAPEGLSCLWHLPEAMGDDDTFQLIFRRIAIGVSWETAAHLCVVGERIFSWRDKQEVCYYVLDEKVLPSAHTVGKELITLKDRYRADRIGCPERPADLVQSIRSLEGLAFYNDTLEPQIARGLWSSFQSFDVTASLHPVPLPDETVVHQDIERLLTERPIDPKSGMLLVDKAKDAMARISFPADLPVQATQAGVSHGQGLPAQSLWMAYRMLQLGYRPINKQQGHVHKPGIGGY